jgi:hypothetical protein
LRTSTIFVTPWPLWTSAVAIASWPLRAATVVVEAWPLWTSAITKTGPIGSSTIIVAPRPLWTAAIAIAATWVVGIAGVAVAAVAGVIVAELPVVALIVGSGVRGHGIAFVLSVTTPVAAAAALTGRKQRNRPCVEQPSHPKSHS